MTINRRAQLRLWEKLIPKSDAAIRLRGLVPAPTQMI